ncbi:hypothetical protein A3B84_01255 [Candidatus Nomurabacteria bacterium RIFCSPHIGHO2_02_FULL_35_13]|uniref:Uncharacterized protein n=1 Tax=Candidatus Nomurabacteria bacterium RIFCSPHIGHO2_02_FULL_35_13 TaxID=1801748 RepID=A0A1F6VPJ1_9BACT|nr:MAG: hypothetical protein UT00_C0020G0001 [Parcubacteria group bacterium GW2011_GWA1_38_7]OGI71617.1 MAG: hypothetical protein A3B84_01255 [Candidatus Nomurabacteria bacterium RIFCSPHIGHO2_02_FULL_35_13]
MIKRFFTCTLEENEGKKGLRFLNKSLADKMNARKQGESFDHISSFRRQLVEGHVNIHGEPVAVFLVATGGLDGGSYLRKLERLVRRFKPFLPGTADNVWLDVQDDVVLTLSKQNQQAVVSIFESISRR